MIRARMPLDPPRRGPTMDVYRTELDRAGERYGAAREAMLARLAGIDPQQAPVRAGGGGGGGPRGGGGGARPPPRGVPPPPRRDRRAAGARAGRRRREVRRAP